MAPWSPVFISIAFLSAWSAHSNATPLGPDQDQLVSDTSDVLLTPGAGLWLPMAPKMESGERQAPEDATIIPTELEDGEVVAVLEPSGLQQQTNPLDYAYPNITASDESDEDGHGIHEVDPQDMDEDDVEEENGSPIQEFQDEPQEEGHGAHLLPVQADENREAEVGVSAWMPPTTPTPSPPSDDALQSANAISSPWADAMTVGLPPSVAYDWHFLLRLASKVRTAPYKPPQDDRTRLKHLLAKIQDAQVAKKLQASMLPPKHQHHLKTQLDAGQLPDDSLTWAWRRASH